MRTLVTAFSLFFLLNVANAQTNVAGNISKDSTWTLVGSPYKVITSFSVNAGFTLKVDSGVVVLFQPGTIMYVSGTLRARQATFTSYRDTNGLGIPQKGDWGTIYMNNAAAVLVLDTCNVKFGGGSSTAMLYSYNAFTSATLTKCNILNSNSWGMSLNASSSLTLTNCTVSNTAASGVYLDAPTMTITGGAVSTSGGIGVQLNGGTTASVSNLSISGANSGQGLWLNSTTSTVSNCVISGSSSHGIHVYAGSATVQNCSVSGSGGQGIYVQSGSLNLTGTSVTTSANQALYFEQGTNITVTNSTLTTAQWPLWENGQASLVFNGTNVLTGNQHNGVYMNYGTTIANLVLDTVAIPYVFPYDFTVNSSHTMTIAPTNVLKFNGGHLYVSGTLKAVAGVGENIYFTSYRDDNLPTPGSDTNADGTGTTPHWGDWGGVVFNDQSVDTACVMRRCKISFAGGGNIGGITMNNASPTIDSCDMSNNYYGAMMQYVSNPVFTNNTIGSSQLVPIAMSFTANPVFKNNTFSSSDNQYDALGLLGGTLTASAVLPIRQVVRIKLGTPDSISNVTYLMLDQVTIPVGDTLTINKGVVIKAYVYWQRIVVQGRIVANATPDSMIVFTSAKDDNFGRPNDTNKDGNATAPGVGDWGGITFESGSDTTSVLNYCSIHYGALPYYYYYYNNIYLSSGAITTINNAAPTISNCEIKDVVYGVYAYGSSKPKIISTKIVNTQYTPIAMSVTADPFFSADTFINAGWRALGIIGEYLGASGTVKQRSISGYNNITYVLLSDMVINSGTNVTINPGVVIKSNGPGFYVNGGLKAKGTIAGGNVVFTSLKDDNFGNPGDTNGDGNATSASAGDWSTIRFQATSDDLFSVLDSCTINYAGNGSWGAVTYTDAGSTLSNSTIFKSNEFGVRCENSSTPTVNSVTITGCRLDPFAISLQSNPTLTNIVFSANGSKGIRILEGTLSSNATLAQRSVAGISNIAYIIDNLTINPGAVLTIAPGVVIKFTGWYNAIAVNGALVANGTRTQKIIFTSLRDDSNGGDTNNDGNGSSPNRGDWATIDFSSSSTDSLNSLRNCEFRYGGSNNYSYEYGLLRFYNTKAVVDSCVVEQSTSSGIGVFGSGHPTISNTQIINISSTPVAMSMFSTPTFSNMTALNVGYMAIGIKPETYSVTASIPVRDFAGYNNITYLMYGTVTVNTGTTITIPAGVVFKDGNWIVNGALVVNGTPTKKVIFTDSRDDGFGNPKDTNGDGAGSSPSVWGTQRVTFNDVSIDSISFIQNAVFRYTDGGIYLQQASPKILDCTFDADNWGVYLDGVSNPSIDSCSFNNLKYAPMRISLVSYPVSTNGNIISGTTYKAIGVKDGETLVQDVTLVKRSFGGVAKIPYLFGNYSVATNSVLTIAPGVVLKFFPGTGLTTHKGLMAKGGPTPDSLIVFTDIRDDFYGGDANSDSTASKPTDWYGGWSGITFASEAIAPSCQLQNCVFRYAGISYNGGAITANNASPTITWSSFNNNYDAIVATGSSNPVVNYCDIYQNGRDGINNVNKSFTIDARWNWWGSNSGPTHSSNPGGTGQAITDSVRYAPFLASGANNPMVGDVSLNGIVQAYDASLILKYVVAPHGPDSLSVLQKRVADVSGNGGADTVAITAYDASLILQYVVGIIPKFPASSRKSDQENQTLMNVLAMQKVSAEATMSVGRSQAKFGDMVSVPLMLSNAGGLTSFQTTIKYDPKLLKAVAVNNSGMGSTMNFAYATNSAAGEVRIAMAGSGVVGTSGEVGTITFQVAGDIHGNVSTPIVVTQFLANEVKSSNASAAGGLDIVGKPTSFGLSQNYPNPFNPSTTISYQVPEDGQHVRIDVYNLTGQLVRTLVNGNQQAGEYKVVWDGTNGFGQSVSSGLYLFRMTSSNFVSVKKMLLVK